MSPKTLKISTPGDREIAMTRVFDAPRELVYTALIKPELLKRWLGVHSGWSLEVCEVDMRVGGAYRYVWRGPNGETMGMGGKYQEIVPGERIVATEAFDQSWYPGSALVTTSLVEAAGKTTLTLTVRYDTREARDHVLKSPMESGVAAGYDQLAEVLSSMEQGGSKKAKQKITPFLWFDHQAEEAANYYMSIFRDSKILATTRYGEAGPGPKGSVMTIKFQLAGQELVALNGGPHFKFTEAISLYVDCQDQAEVDELWAKLSAGGEEGPCGWLKDRYGLSWQIVPSAFVELMQGSEPECTKRMMEAMMQMKKLDLARLQRAYRGEDR